MLVGILVEVPMELYRIFFPLMRCVVRSRYSLFLIGFLCGGIATQELPIVKHSVNHVYSWLREELQELYYRGF